MGAIEDIMSLPEAERLPYALGIIRALLGEDEKFAHAMVKYYGLSHTERVIVSILHKASPRAISKDALVSAYSWATTRSEESGSEASLTVNVSKIRAKGIHISTVRSLGYAMPKSMANVLSNIVEDHDMPPPGAIQPAVGSPARPMKHAGGPWTDTDRKALLEGLARGLHTWEIARTLYRSERAVTDYIAKWRESPDAPATIRSGRANSSGGSRGHVRRATV